MFFSRPKPRRVPAVRPILGYTRWCLRHHSQDLFDIFCVPFPRFKKYRHVGVGCFRTAQIAAGLITCLELPTGPYLLPRSVTTGSCDCSNVDSRFCTLVVLGVQVWPPGSRPVCVLMFWFRGVLLYLGTFLQGVFPRCWKIGCAGLEGGQPGLHTHPRVSSVRRWAPLLASACVVCCLSFGLGSCCSLRYQRNVHDQRISHDMPVTWFGCWEKRISKAVKSSSLSTTVDQKASPTVTRIFS